MRKYFRADLSFEVREDETGEAHKQVLCHHTRKSVKVFSPSLIRHLYFPPVHPLGLFPSLHPYQDVWEAEVIVMTQCRTLRSGSEQAATMPFPCALWQRETG